MPAQNIDVLLRLLNNRRFTSGMYSAGRSIRAFGADAERAAASTRLLEAVQHTGIGVLGAFASAATLASEAVVGIAAATVVMGVKFNATMESNSLAFTKFASSAKEARKFTQELFNVAKEGPFSFESILQGSRRLLAFGFSIKQTLPLMKAMSNALSFTGGSQDEVLRTAKALGEIRSMGFLKQRQVNQLITAGLPVDQIMKAGGKEFTKEQLKNIGNAHMTAQSFLTTFQKGLETKYAGGNKAFLKTFTGQFQRFTDNLNQAAGTVTKRLGIFDWVKKELNKSNDLLNPKDRKGKAAQFISDDTLDKIKSFGKIAKTAFVGGVQGVKQFITAIKPAAPFFENVLWPIIKGIGKALLSTFALGIGVITVLAKVLGWLGERARPLRGIFETVGYVIGLLFGGVILKAIGKLKALHGILTPVRIAAGLMALPFKVGFLVFSRFGGVVISLIARLGRFAGRLNFLGPVLSGIRGMVTRIQGVLANMVGWMVNRLGRLGPMLFHIGAKAARGFADGFKQIGKFLIGVFTSVGSGLVNIGDSVRKWLNDNTPFGDKIDLGFLGSVHIPALALGGDITRGGVALVGENGPEMVRLPTGSNVAPMRPARARRGSGRGYPMEAAESSFSAVRVAVHAPVYLDRRQIGQAMGEYVAERQARR